MKLRKRVAVGGVGVNVEIIDANLTTSLFCPVLQRIVFFAPRCQSNYKPRTPSQNVAFGAIISQFEKGKIYDKSNVRMPRQHLPLSLKAL